ncbi:MAG: hypothetical protein JWM11_4378 [Planctomycetaceae bacterium]|nr:hypothetical protein [Planctomycetaceae bacterium]
MNAVFGRVERETGQKYNCVHEVRSRTDSSGKWSLRRGVLVGRVARQWTRKRRKTCHSRRSSRLGHEFEMTVSPTLSRVSSEHGPEWKPSLLNDSSSELRSSPKQIRQFSEIDCVQRDCLTAEYPGAPGQSCGTSSLLSKLKTRPPGPVLPSERTGIIHIKVAR